MTREYARLRLDMWVTGDIRLLSPPAQHLYFVLLTHPQLSYCGVTDWRPTRLAAMATGWSAGDIIQAGAELFRKLFVIIDEGTEEVLVRSFIRNDGLMKNARVAVSMVHAFGAIASPTLRGVVVHELRRLHAEDQTVSDPAQRAKGWLTTGGKPGLALDLLDLPVVDPASLPQVLPQGLGEGLPQGLGQTQSNVWGSVCTTTSPAPTPAPTPTPNGVVGLPAETPPTTLMAVPNSEPAKASRRQVKRPLPADFTITPSMRAWANSQKLNPADVDHQTEEFKTWVLADGRHFADWEMAWRNSIQRAVDNGRIRKATPRPILNEWDMPRQPRTPSS